MLFEELKGKKKVLNKHGTLYMLDHCSRLDDDGISKLFNSLIILTTLQAWFSWCQTLGCQKDGFIKKAEKTTSLFTFIF